MIDGGGLISGKATERRRTIGRALGPGIPAVPVVDGAAACATAWKCDWFIPLVEPRMSVAVGREVTIAHLHICLRQRQ